VQYEAVESSDKERASEDVVCGKFHFDSHCFSAMSGNRCPEEIVNECNTTSSISKLKAIINIWEPRGAGAK
jgi:hypothetical protein